MEPYIIRSNRGIQLKFILLCLASICIVARVLITNYQSNPIVFSGAVLVLVVLIPLLFNFLLHFIKPKDLLVIDEMGFVDHSHFFDAKRIYWEDVESLRIYLEGNMEYIGVDLVNKTEYLESLGFLERKLMCLHLAEGRCPITIPVHEIDKSPQEIYHVMTKYAQHFFGEQNLNMEDNFSVFNALQ